MKVIILAAGYATRLYPLTKNFPKPLLPVGGKPILDWLVDDIASMTDEFIVISNHKFFSHFEKWAAGKNVSIRVIDDGTESNESRLGAVKDIQLAATESCDYFVMAGDNVLDFSLRAFIEFAKNKGTSCVMCHEENSISALQRTAVISVDENSRITSYEEKPKEPKGNLAVPPFYYYLAKDISRIAEALENGCGFDAPGNFAAWLSFQVPMHAWKMTGSRHDIGDMKSYEAVKENFTGPHV